MPRDKRTIWTISTLSVVLAASYVFYRIFMLDEAFDLASLFRVVVMVLVLWLILPLVRFREYAKSPALEKHDLTRMKRSKFLLSLLTIGMTVAFAKNLADEGYLQPDWGFVGVIVALWLGIPLVNFFVGMRTANRKSLRMSLVVAVYYFLWMLSYALDGSTQNEMGAEHMHVIFAPFAMLLFSPVVLYGEFCLRRFEAWLERRGEVIGSRSAPGDFMLK